MSGRSKRKKKRGSDDDSAEDTSATNSADEAFYASIESGAGRRTSGRERRATVAMEDYSHDFEGHYEDGSSKKRKKLATAGGSAKNKEWTQEADDALLSAIVKHGLGNGLK